MITPTALLRAKLAIATLTVATVGATAMAPTAHAATPAEPARAAQHVAVQLLAETSDSAAVIGVADSNLYDLDAEALTARLSELQALGVTDLRVAVPWVYIEPAAGSYNWSKMDALVEAATAMGFTLTAAVTATPAWAGLILAGAPDPATYAAFAGSVAQRYGSQIASYEVWNEPNGVIFYAPVDPARYTEMLKAAYTAIKAANPEAVVLAGSLGATTNVPGISITPQQFLAAMYEAGAAGYFDALSYHPYHFTLPFSQGGGTANTPLEQVKALYDLMVANGDAGKQIWATEYGTATTPGWGVTPAEQAALLRDFLTAWSKLAFTGPAFVYTSQDVQTGILNHEYNFGLFTSDGKPKPAAQVLAELIAASGIGSLPDYTAPRMSAARDLYLQLASVGFGLANMALVIPNAAIAVIYNLMPGPLQRAFTAVANAVSSVVAQVAMAVSPAVEAALGVLVRALPQPPAVESTPEGKPDEQSVSTVDAYDERASLGQDSDLPAASAASVTAMALPDADLPASSEAADVDAAVSGQKASTPEATAPETMLEEPLETLAVGDLDASSTSEADNDIDSVADATEQAPLSSTPDIETQRDVQGLTESVVSPADAPRTAAGRGGAEKSDRVSDVGSGAARDDEGKAPSPRTSARRAGSAEESLRSGGGRGSSSSGTAEASTSRNALSGKEGATSMRPDRADASDSRHGTGEES